MAQQRSHVPKFGNWEGDNVPYTAFFDTARKEKVGTNGVMINPNDPSQNPEAFKYIANSNTNNNNNGIESEVSGSGPTSSLEQSAVSSEKYHGDTEGRGGGGGQRRPLNYGNYNKSTMTTSESMSSDKSNDYSVLNLPARLDIDDHHKIRSWNNPPPIDNNNRQLRPAGRLTNPNDDISFRSTASVPKFGAWDDQDPRSGEGFTVIFNKVKEEKQTAAAKFPPVHVQYQNTNTPQHDSSKSSKRYCCLF